MGGTSTDVSRYAGRYEHVYESTTAGVTIQAPQLDVNTVAAGGGSMLFFRYKNPSLYNYMIYDLDIIFFILIIYHTDQVYSLLDQNLPVHIQARLVTKSEVHLQ